MASETEVMREFLVSLGFAVDGTGQKKFGDALKSTATLATSAGKAVAAVGLAAQAMVATFASSMEKMYYASRRTGASVDNLQAAEFGARNIGLAAGQSTEQLEAMAAAIRMNPGMRGLLNNILGKDTSGDDPTASMIELVKKLSAMPHAVGANFAQMFGIDERSFLMLKQGIDEYERAYLARKKMGEAMGVNGDAAAKASKEYMNSLRELTERVELLAQKLSIYLLPAFRQLSEYLNKSLDSLANFKTNSDLAPLLKDLRDIRAELRNLFGDVDKDKTLSTMHERGRAIASSMLNIVKGILRIANGDFSGAAAALGEAISGAVSNAPGTVAVKKLWDMATGDDKASTPAPTSAPGGPVVMRGVANSPQTDLSGDWAAINASYRAGQGTRDAMQRELLQNEYAVETDPTRRAMMERFMRSVNVTPPTGTAERTAAAPAATAAPGATVTQNNDIKIFGSEQKAALHDAKEFLGRVGADLTRNFKGATR